MNKKVMKKHSYLIFLGFCLAVTYFIITAHSTLASLKFVIMVSIGLLMWSLLHHFFDKSLTWEVIAEYILTIALVILSVVYFLL